MSAFRLRLILVIVVSFVLHRESFAQRGLFGCWNNINHVPVDPNYSPMHASTAVQGYMMCFKDNGSITMVIVGGFEALGTEGKFSYRAGHLRFFKADRSDGWPFAFQIDHCDVKINADQLKISDCKGWEKSKAIILHSQTNSPELDGVAAGLFH